MTSGRKLRAEQVNAIIHLAGLKRDDGEWLLSKKEIAERLGLHERTVRRCIREVAVQHGKLTGGKTPVDDV